MKRRIFSLLLAVLLLIPWTFASAATAPVIITSEDVRGKVGDTVTATLNITVEPPKLNQTMDSLQFVLEYDSAALEFDGIQEVSGDRINILGAQFTCSVTTKTGGVAFSAAATSGASGSGTLMHVRFKILSAVSTMLVLKKVSYSFVTSGSGSQRGYTGGTLNLGRITGESVPTTIVPASYSPYDSPQPSPSASDSAEPRFPVTEVSPMPGASPEPQENEGDSDALAYIVFALFIVVAILICVVLTLMIVRRGRKAREALLEDEEDLSYEEDTFDEEGYSEDPYGDEPYEKPNPASRKKSKTISYEDEEDDEPPIQVVRRGKKK